MYVTPILHVHGIFTTHTLRIYAAHVVCIYTTYTCAFLGCLVEVVDISLVEILKSQAIYVYIYMYVFIYADF